MPSWDKIKKNLGNLADKTVTKTMELSDTASLKIKIASKESDRDIAYKKLGKLAYVKLKRLEGCDSAELTEKIGKTLEELDVRTGERKPIEGIDEKSNVLQWLTEDGTKVSVRPSGTEPKIKFYFGVKADLPSVEQFDEVQAQLDAKIEQIKKDLNLI